MAPSPAVDAWLQSLDHPQKDLISALRARMLAADPRVEEGIKWNSGSYRLHDWFATFHVRGKGGPAPVMLVLHRGAKVGAAMAPVADPSGLLKWQGPARATITLADVAELEAKSAAFDAVIGAWIAGL